jgi:hypothetical protein
MDFGLPLWRNEEMEQWQAGKLSGYPCSLMSRQGSKIRRVRFGVA